MIREELQRIQRALEDGRRFLTGELSYADIAIGVALLLLGPLPGQTLIGVAKLAYDPVLDAEFATMRAWRDALHAVEPLLPEVGPQPSAAEDARAARVLT